MLNAKHLAELRASGLTDETITASGIYTARGEHVREKLGWSPKAGMWGEGFMIPFRDANGGNGYYRFKPDFPRTKAKSDTLLKYESPLKVAGRAYFPPGFWKTDQGTILFTEGEKKALAATQAGFPCIGLVGVYGWQVRRPKRNSGSATGSKRLIEDLREIPWNGKNVHIMFDSDAEENPAVNKAANELAAILHGQGATVHVLFCEPGPAGARHGLDDMLVGYGEDGPNRLQTLLSEAEPFKPSDSELPEKMGPMGYADALIAERFTYQDMKKLRWHNSEFYVWDRRRYRPVPFDDMTAEVLNLLDQKIKHVRPKLAREVVECMGARSLVPFAMAMPVWLGSKKDSPGPADSLIAMSNGLLSLDDAVDGTNKLRQPTPEWFSTVALPYAFDPAAECPGWVAFLTDVFDGDDERISLIQEWFGYCLSRDTAHQAILLCEGPKRAGKGVTLRMLRAVVGKDNVVAPRLSTLGDSFGMQGLLGKTVAICPDAHLGRGDQVMGVLEILKCISGEDAVEVHRKHLPSVTVRLGVRFALAVNELPRFADNSNALASRLLILPFRKSYAGTEDRTLDKRLGTEVSGVFNWAVRGLQRLRQQCVFTVPAISADVTEDFKRMSSPVSAFVEDECDVSPSNQVAKATLYKEFREWCDRSGGHPSQANVFSHRLKRCCPDITTERTNEDGLRRRRWLGIGLLSGKQ